MTDIRCMQDYMQRAIALAAKGSGWVNPNPQVGAVLVKDGRIIGEGWHERFGDLHAERNAIASASEPLKNATLYVTLEPCCHFGKTPPCTEAIIERGISRVVIGSLDPNPQVAGKGAALLRKAGLEVTTGFMQRECDKLNEIFFHYIQTKTPYVLMKYAMTADGKIATFTGASKWITGEKARADVHRLRGRYAAILVGIGTVFADDPLLNCRINGGHNPLRVICDSGLRIPLESQIVQTAAVLPTLIATVSSDGEKIARLKEHGCDVLVMPDVPIMPDVLAALDEADAPRTASAPDDASASASSSAPASSDARSNKRVDLKLLMKLLGERAIDSVLIEGGPTLHGSALEAGIVNKARCYIAPKLFGGRAAPSPIGGLGVNTPDDAFHLTNLMLEMFGEDYCIEGDVIGGAITRLPEENKGETGETDVYGNR